MESFAQFHAAPLFEFSVLQLLLSLALALLLGTPIGILLSWPIGLGVGGGLLALIYALLGKYSPLSTPC